MTNSFTQLKNSRKAQLEKLTADLSKKTTYENSSQDSRFWKPTVDKAGNGYAVIRFLPTAPGEDTPVIKYWDHSFKGPGGWYIEKSLTTLGQKDPVSEYNTQLWATELKENRDIVSNAQKRRLHYISNIYIVKDPANPENEGKVFLYQYGKKVYDKINEKLEPVFEDETPVFVFDFWEGANFKLKIQTEKGKDGSQKYRSYDKSEWDVPSALHEDDDVLENIWKQQHPLKPLVAPSMFKTYDELKQRLHKVLGWDSPSFDTNNRSFSTAEEMSAPKVKEVQSKPIQSSSFEEDSDDDEGLDFFKRMVEED